MINIESARPNNNINLNMSVNFNINNASKNSGNNPPAILAQTIKNINEKLSRVHYNTQSLIK